MTSAEIAVGAMRKTDSRRRAIRLATLVFLAFLLVVRDGGGGSAVVSILVTVAIVLAACG